MSAADFEVVASSREHPTLEGVACGEGVNERRGYGKTRLRQVYLRRQVVQGA
jgi:hypothetical protein